jgi:Cu2+-exporting ATPase
MFILKFMVVLSIATAQLVIKAVAKTGEQLFTEQHDNMEESETGLYPVKFTNPIKCFLAATDDVYQDLVCRHIDPLLSGGMKEKHLQDMRKGRKRILSEREKETNRSLGMAVIALCLLVVTYLTSLPLLPFVIAAGIYIILPFYRDAWLSYIQDGRLGIMHVLIFNMSFIWLSGYFIVGLMGEISFALFLKFRSAARIGARQNLMEIVDFNSRTVWIDKNGIEIEIPFESLNIGDILVLDIGQIIPVDGVVVKGLALIDQHRLTGESVAAEKQAGDTVFASTLLVAGRLWVLVEKNGSDTAAAQILHILNNTIDEFEISITREFEEAEHTLIPMLAAGLLGWVIAGPAAGVAVLEANFIIDYVSFKLITFLNASVLPPITAY